MTPAQAATVTDLSRIVVLAAFFAAILFLVVYSLVAPWWRTSIGRALVIMDIGIALAMLPLFLKFAFDLSTADLFFAWLQIGSIGLVAISTLWRSWIVARVQWRERQHDEAE